MATAKSLQARLHWSPTSPPMPNAFTSFPIPRSLSQKATKKFHEDRIEQLSKPVRPSSADATKRTTKRESFASTFGCSAREIIPTPSPSRPKSCDVSERILALSRPRDNYCLVCRRLVPQGDTTRMLDEKFHSANLDVCVRCWEYLKLLARKDCLVEAESAKDCTEGAIHYEPRFDPLIPPSRIKDINVDCLFVVNCTEGMVS